MANKSLFKAGLWRPERDTRAASLVCVCYQAGRKDFSTTSATAPTGAGALWAQYEQLTKAALGREPKYVFNNYERHEA